MEKHRKSHSTSKALSPFYSTEIYEAGCDEAGRGCLAGPVFAAAVILPANCIINGLNDSKKLSANKRQALKTEIEQKALAYCVASVNNVEIDKINILNASILAMHIALQGLGIQPQHIIVDGNRFKPYNNIPHTCIVEGDAKYMSIAAASVLAKTYRDLYMQQQHLNYPHYNWIQNKGYPTFAHRNAILQYGLTPLHRNSFMSKIILQPTLF